MFKRIATAIVLVGFLAAVLYFAPARLFDFFTLIVIGLGLREFYKLAAANDRFSMICGLVLGLTSAAWLIFYPDPTWFIYFFIAAFFILVTAHMFRYTTVEEVVKKIGVILFGTVYLAFTLPAFAWLRHADHGRGLIVMTIAIVALGDSFAYAAGKAFGKRKLSPLISPNKTVEGFIASFAGGVVAAVICWQVFWSELSVALVIFLGLVVALIGALGDLIESLIKRAYHTKDSGNILPGHGGVLDRLDALVFAAPFVYFVFKFLNLI